MPDRDVFYVAFPKSSIPDRDVFYVARRTRSIQLFAADTAGSTVFTAGAATLQATR
jgi:hypothetical protein